ncbi:type II toxin-antitoxin system RelE/ParE family toxin [Sphingomonas phyllosphaerae]|uniref:type II toxin-antitoxin system RelE/ParE family toxin n=1 Tax=Sphingomonas phyllosphaerae TaxID=257003 RepID=UPI003D6C50F4
MARVVWTDRAIQQLQQIVDYINALDPGAARRMPARLVAATTSLRHFPQRGRLVRHGYASCQAYGASSFSTTFRVTA